MFEPLTFTTKNADFVDEGVRQHTFTRQCDCLCWWKPMPIMCSSHWPFELAVISFSTIFSSTISVLMWFVRCHRFMGIPGLS